MWPESISSPQNSLTWPWPNSRCDRCACARRCAPRPRRASAARPLSFSVSAAFSPAMPAPTIAMRGGVGRARAGVNRDGREQNAECGSAPDEVAARKLGDAAAAKLGRRDAKTFGGGVLASKAPQRAQKRGSCHSPLPHHHFLPASHGKGRRSPRAAGARNPAGELSRSSPSAAAAPGKSARRSAARQIPRGRPGRRA